MVPGFASAFTVTIAVLTPHEVVYEMVVVPELMPVTTPPVDIVPVAGVLLLHVPPERLAESDVVPVGQTVSVPDIVISASCETVAVTVPVQLFASVRTHV
jgi:hypothetical protein